MGASFPRYLDATDDGKGMVQFCPIGLEPALDRSSPRGHASMRGWNELHALRHEGEDVVPPLVDNLLPAAPHVAWMCMARRYPARMHGIFHERRAYEHGRAIGARERDRVRRSEE